MTNIKQHIRELWPLSYEFGYVYYDSLLHVVIAEHDNNIVRSNGNYVKSPQFIAALNKTERVLEHAAKSESTLRDNQQLTDAVIALIMQEFPLVSSYYRMQPCEDEFGCTAVKFSIGVDTIIPTDLLQRGSFYIAIYNRERGLKKLESHREKCAEIRARLPMPIAHRVVKWLYPI